MTDFETFMLDDGYDRIFRIQVYRRMFTPLEQDRKYIDESVYENGNYMTLIKIVEVIELPDKDILLGVKEWDEVEQKLFDCVTYYKLSEIRLSYYESDNVVEELLD